MIVAQEDVAYALAEIKKVPELGLDVETYGLRPYHGDRFFSVGVAISDKQTYYFNFHPYPEPHLQIDSRFILDRERTLDLFQRELFDDSSKLWFAHNAKFELHMLAQDSCHLAGLVHCTQAIGRVVYNEHQRYDLDASLCRIGLSKDDAVEKYIDEHQLFEKVAVPGRKQPKIIKWFEKVPFEIMARYCQLDAAGTRALGLSQLAAVAETQEQDVRGPSIQKVYNNEVALTKALFRMEANGCRIDLDYCREAIARDEIDLRESILKLEEGAGRPFVNSAKWLGELFAGYEDRFTYKINRKSKRKLPTLRFDNDALQKIPHPLVPQVLRYRTAKNRLGFFLGFLHHADEFGIVHPHFNSDRARHGRFSSSEPNFQNLKNNEESEDDPQELQEDTETEFHVRRAIIPRDGNILLVPDYSGVEYALMLEYACRRAGRIVPLATMVNDGMKIHKATVELCADRGVKVKVEEAKTANFLTIYGGGAEALANELKCDVERAHEIRAAIKNACPEAHQALHTMIQTARNRGWIFNWFGRRCYFPNRELAYKAPNYCIAGGVADVMKLTIVNGQTWLDKEGFSALPVLTIHDEYGLDCPRSEAPSVAKGIEQIMESVFPAQYVPLRVTMKWCEKSLADKIDGVPA